MPVVGLERGGSRGALLLGAEFNSSLVSVL